MLKRLLAAAVAVVLFAGCVSPAAIQAKDPLVTYYAALADFNTSKRIALSYVLLESTSRAEADAVVLATQKGDAAIKQVEKLRTECAASSLKEADALVPPIGAELTSQEFSDAFQAAHSVTLAACLPASRLEAVGRILQAVSAELRARAAKGK